MAEERGRQGRGARAEGAPLTTLYEIVLLLHSLVRWLVVGLGVVVLVRSLLAWRAARAWRRVDERLQVAFLGVVDLQLTLGLLLYLWLSPLPSAAFHDLGATMKEPILRFFGIEHPFGMIVAIVVVHAVRSRSRKKGESPARHRMTALALAVFLALVLGSIPWPGFAHGRALWPL